MLFSRKAKKAELIGATDAAVTPRTSVPEADKVRVGERAYTTTSHDALTFGDYAGGFRRTRIVDAFQTFLRQLRWAVPLFLVGVAGLFWVTKDFQRSYTGQGRVLAQIASEYVYDPVAGQAAPGLMITPDHIVLNEIGIMTSPTVIRRVLGDLAALHGFSAVDPVNANKLRAGEAPGDNPDIYRAFEKSLFASPQAKSSVIDMGFKHSNPEIAVDGLNLFIDAYLEERQTLFVSGTADVVSRRREATEGQLSQNEREIAAFLRRNEVSDFNSERKGATERTEALKTELNTLRGSMAEAERSLREVEDQLRATPATIDLFVDDRASQRVAQAELELKQLLAKYLPGSDPVRQKQVEIAELKSLQTANGGRAAGGRRVGPNPVQQELTTRRNTLAAQAELELKQLLAKYLPGSDPVRQKQVEIAELKSLQTANGGRAAGGRRVGPNPVQQELTTRRNTLAAQADALREKEIVLQTQLNSADSKTRRLRDLSPRFENLLRERETLQARLRGLNTKEQEALIAQQQAQAASENIRVISRPTSAIKGRNMQMLAWLGSSLVWGVVVALLTLLATFLSPRLMTATPGPAQSVDRGSRRAGGRRSDDHAIPEPVAPYIPAVPEPVAPSAPPQTQPAIAPGIAPAWAPAAQAVIPDNPYAPAAQEYAESYAEPAQMTGTDGPQIFADVPAAVYGNDAPSAAYVQHDTPIATMGSQASNPYLSGATPYTG